MKTFTRFVWKTIEYFGMLEETINDNIKVSVDQALSILPAKVLNQELIEVLTQGFMDGIVEEDTTPSEYYPMIRTAFHKEATARLRHY